MIFQYYIVKTGEIGVQPRLPPIYHNFKFCLNGNLGTWVQNLEQLGPSENLSAYRLKMVEIGS